MGEVSSASIAVSRDKKGRWKEKEITVSYNHAYERFYLALEQLATAPGDVRSRLERAYSHLDGLLLRELPGDLRTDFEWIKRMLTRREPRWEDDNRIKASLARMRNSTGVKIAKRILKLKETLGRRLRGE